MEVVNEYTEHVPFELGVKLKEYGYWNPGCTYESSYNGPCYFKTKRFYKDGVVANWNDITPAPTYAEVFDWLANEKGVIIQMKPFFTFALKSHIAFTWIVSYLDHKNLGGPVIRNVGEGDVYDGKEGFGGSFKLTANAAIEYAMTVKSSFMEFEEVKIEEL